MSSSQVCRAHLSSVFAGQKLDSKEKEDRGEEKSRRYRVTGDITTAEWSFPPRSVRPFIRALSAPSVILPQNGRADLFFLSSPFIVHLPSPRNTSFLEETSSSSSSSRSNCGSSWEEGFIDPRRTKRDIPSSRGAPPSFLLLLLLFNFYPLFPLDFPSIN